MTGPMRSPLTGLGILATMVACRVERLTPVSSADLVLQGGAVYTLQAEKPWADAVAVREGRIIFVGDAAGAARYVGASTRVFDLAGRMVLPGFQDTHAHPLSGGLEEGECNLYEARTPDEIEGLIRACAARSPQQKWVRGNGWQLPVFPRGNPRRELLDRLIPDRPAFFWAADGHSAWVNSRALQEAGITRDTPDPPNGHIERDRVTGEASGTLRESATDLVARELPPYSLEERLGAVRRALAMANRFGITSITDADAGPDYLEAYRTLDDRGELTARVTAALHSEHRPVAEETRRLEQLRQRFAGGDLLAVNTVKLFADGVIEARTAAVLSPYLDRPGNSGTLNYTAEDLTARVRALDAAGFQIHVHAIGDRAIRAALDALAEAREANGPRDARPVLAHLELFDPADIPRFRDLGAIASFQPYWAQADDYIRDLTIPAIGPARSRWLYPIASMMNSGAVVAGGSDWTVSSLNPLDAIQVAITRRDLADSTGPAWIPEERVDLPRMLAAYTINGAYATRLERETGTIEPGKSADLVVLDRNLFAIPPTGIHRARVLLTLLEGREVWRDSAMVGAKPVVGH